MKRSYNYFHSCKFERKEQRPSCLMTVLDRFVIMKWLIEIHLKQQHVDVYKKNIDKEKIPESKTC